jgi:hypothetical protein
MAEGVFKGGFPERAGYTNFDWELNLQNFAVGTVRTAVLWMPETQMLDDFSWFLDAFETGVDGRTYYRSAH